MLTMQGKNINGYTLTELLGTGGMAEVWLAENKLGKTAAVKVLLSKFRADDNIKPRFYTEAKVMVALNHPYIRQVYDYGEIDGRPAIVMEYLEGNDLKARMKRGQRFSDEELKKWWNQLVDALNYTHQKGIVHRDIKPGNIFVDKQGNVKLLDFGIAKVRESISATQTGQKLGTLMYMSPEQVKDSKSIDYHTDIYSLAVTFVHLVSGKAPYDSDSSSDFEISEQIVYKPLDISTLPKFWVDTLTPYLNKTPAQRPDLRPLSIGVKAQPAPQRPVVDDDEGTMVGGNGFEKDWSSPFDDDAKTLSPKRQPAQVKSQPVTAQKSHKKRTLWVVLLSVLVLALGGVLAWVLTSQNQRQQMQIQILTERYTEKVNALAMPLENMDQDRNNNVANELLIFQALDLLKEIEQMEQRSVFDKTGLVPQYSRKYTEFKSKLHKAELLLSSCISDQIRRGSADEDNPYYVGLREKLGLVKNLIKQSEQGDALSIQRPQRQS